MKYFPGYINSSLPGVSVKLVFIYSHCSLLSGEAQRCRDSHPALTPQWQQLQLRLIFLLLLVLVLRHQ